jgi:hypothetical protein
LTTLSSSTRGECGRADEGDFHSNSQAKIPK